MNYHCRSESYDLLIILLLIFVFAILFTGAATLSIYCIYNRKSDERGYEFNGSFTEDSVVGRQVMFLYRIYIVTAWMYFSCFHESLTKAFFYFEIIWNLEIELQETHFDALKETKVKTLILKRKTSCQSDENTVLSRWISRKWCFYYPVFLSSKVEKYIISGQRIASILRWTSIPAPYQSCEFVLINGQW